jgi:putative (di)nucleoside polyphosphate hydrolase
MTTTGEYFRSGVGAMIVDPSARRVLVFRRADVKDESAWQLPQGGIERGESPREAMAREVSEESGLRPDDYEILDELDGWLAYELPEAYRSEKTGLGQVQKWFLLQIKTGRDVRVDHEEFDESKWVPLEEVVPLAAPFRRSVYRALADRAGARLTGQ